MPFARPRRACLALPSTSSFNLDEGEVTFSQLLSSKWLDRLSVKIAIAHEIRVTKTSHFRKENKLKLIENAKMITTDIFLKKKKDLEHK